MFCTRCGHPNPADAPYCSHCGAPQGVAVQAQTTGIPGASVTAYASGQVSGYQARSAAGYGGFWLRVLAFVIDFIVISVVLFPFRFLFWGVGSHGYAGIDRPIVAPFLFAFGMFTGLARFVLGWVYWAGMESSGYQATLGKMAVGLKVTDLAGQRISFGRATGRYFGKILSWMILGIGFLMVAFTERKQGLHDMLAGTLVVKKS